MLGSLVTLLFCLSIASIGVAVVRHLSPDLCPLSKFGVGGLISLGTIGTISFLIGLFPGGLKAIPAVVILFSIVGLFLWTRVLSGKNVKPLLVSNGLFVGLCLLVTLITLIGASGPSDMNDWDSLAYHLAAPKIWSAQGSISYIPFIHQSNFPFAADSLYFSGAIWGGEKAFMAMTLLFGCFAAYGITSSVWSKTSGLVSAALVAGMPVVLWESTTAYIDGFHGIMCGLGAMLCFKGITQKGGVATGAILLGFGVASKYTGLQALLAVLAVIVAHSLLTKSFSQGMRSASIVFGICIAMSSPWFVRNIVNTGNPVYPFFYSVFKSDKWDQFMADIYQNEQKSFGVGYSNGRLDSKALGHAVLGLSYQPGRYVNPQQTIGGGSPTGSVGVAVLLAGVFALLAGKPKREEKMALAMVLILLLMWFGLSQQSRYLSIIGVPLALSCGSLFHKRNAFSSILAFCAGAQLVYSTYLVWTVSIAPKIPVLTGEVSQREYWKATLPSVGPSIEILNQSSGKIALYDDVFGYVLEKPYVWANPGHSKLFDYEKYSSGEELVIRMKELGISTVLLNFQWWQPREEVSKWMNLSTIDPSGAGYSSEEISAMKANRETKWKWLLGDAVRTGHLKIAPSGGGSSIILVL